MKITRPFAAALTLLVTALGACATVTVGAAPAVAADSPTVVVSWPEVTRFNPRLTTYEPTVTDQPAGAHLFTTWSWPDESPWNLSGTPVPASGTVPVDFSGSYQGHGAVRVWTCPTESWSGSCTEAARSPELDVYSSMRIYPTWSDASPYRHSGTHHVDLGYWPEPALAGAPTASWRLLGADQKPLPQPVGGPIAATDLTRDPTTGYASIPFTIPPGLASGDYYLDVDMSVDSDDFGHLEGSALEQGVPLRVVVDNDAPTLRVSKTAPVIYPVSDGYLDAVALDARSSESTSGSFKVTNAAGKVVYRSDRHAIDAQTPAQDQPHWSGRQGRTIVPEGRYTMSLTVADWAGNSATWSAPVTVSHKALRWTTFKRTVTATASRTGKPWVGRCSTLAKPAKGGPVGSLGYYSQTKCKGDAAASTVATDHGMYIPKAFRNHYQWFQVTLNGGPATASASNYIILGYRDPRTGDLVNTRQLGKGAGAHRGQRVGSPRRSIFDADTDEPYLIWSNGLNGGSRYNVRSYTVAVRYQALR